MNRFTTDSAVTWKTFGVGQSVRNQRPRFLSGASQRRWRRVPKALEGRLNGPIVITKWGWASKWIDQQWYNPGRRRNCLFRRCQKTHKREF